MKKVTPNYYTDFKCIADKCRHNCCIGWEITVDNDTLKYYSTVKGELGKRLSDSISPGGCFVLDNKKRCPFLNECGLCDIITELGDKALCEICKEHPRFYNFYSDFCEVGIGMCCEHGAEIILGCKQSFCLGDVENVNITAEEKHFFSLRQSVFDVLQNRTEGILQRVEKLCNEYGFSLTDIFLEGLIELFLSLERLDDTWTKHLKALEKFKFDTSFFDDENLCLPFEQLLCYFIFRHFDINKANYYEAVCFACAGFLVIGALCAMHKERFSGLEITDISEYARLFSSEVEYNAENMENVMKFFE